MYFDFESHIDINFNCRSAGTAKQLLDWGEGGTFIVTQYWGAQDTN